MKIEIFNQKWVGTYLSEAETVREHQHRPDKAIALVKPLAGVMARRDLERWRNVASDADWVTVAGAMRIATVSANTLMDTGFTKIRDYLYLLPQQQDAWFSKHQAELESRRYTRQQIPTNWIDEWRLNDRLGTAQRIPRIRNEVIVDTETMLQDRDGINYLPGGIRVGEIPNNNAADASVAGVAIARLWKLGPEEQLKDRALELVRWANGENGVIPNPDRLAVVENWLAKDKPETRLPLRKQLGIDLMALRVLARRDVDPFVWD